MSLADTPAFAQFKDVFKGDLVLPTDTEYKASIRRWSVLAERPAGLVAFIKDEQDVAAAVNFAVKQKLEIAIKGRSSLRHPRHTGPRPYTERWRAQSVWSVLYRWRCRD